MILSLIIMTPCKHAAHGNANFIDVWEIFPALLFHADSLKSPAIKAEIVRAENQVTVWFPREKGDLTIVFGRNATGVKVVGNEGSWRKLFPWGTFERATKRIPFTEQAEYENYVFAPRSLPKIFRKLGDFCVGVRRDNAGSFNCSRVDRFQGERS